MAESESSDCPCSNITIMQLFHELKQRYPTVPDQIVSKVIQENCHDKFACEIILHRESHNYLQSYPGALISGSARSPAERGPLCSHCSAGKILPLPLSELDNTGTGCSFMPDNMAQMPETCNLESAFLPTEGSRSNNSNSSARVKHLSCYEEGSKKEEIAKIPRPLTLSNDILTKTPIGQLIKEMKLAKCKEQVEKTGKDESETKSCKEIVNNCMKESETSAKILTDVSGIADAETKDTIKSESSSVITQSSDDRLREDDDSESAVSERSDCVDESQSKVKEIGYREEVTRRWSVEDEGRRCDIVSGSIMPSSSSHRRVNVPVVNYQVAVECQMQPVTPSNWMHQSTVPGEVPRSFTSVNLTLRPPSYDPQPPIEIQSGPSLTYTTSKLDPRQGFQSQLQIRIGPGGGGTVSACRTQISSPLLRFCSSSSSQSSAGHRCQNRQHIRALLEKQKERRDLLARELRKEKEKLRLMQKEVRKLEEEIAQRSSPKLLPKIKAEIVRLRTECKQLATTVDLYSDSQNFLPLGETNEEFYRNIYTGQRLQTNSCLVAGEGSWSCQACTFRNHPLLGICEQCEMPRLSLGTATSDVSTSMSSVFSNSNNALRADAGTSTSVSLTTAPLQDQLQKQPAGETLDDLEDLLETLEDLQ